MVLHPIPGGLEANGDVRRVIDAEAIEQHVLVQAAGFDNDPAELRAFMPAQVVASAERFYLGYADGVPAATAVMVPTPPDAGIFAVSTDPAYRRRGLGRAVTVAGVRDAAAAGCDLVYLQASEMGYPLYEALGFRTVELYRTFVRRPGEPAP
jgi:ribosomal protein S18 acetylase RimI-like enzyme